MKTLHLVVVASLIAGVVGFAVPALPQSTSADNMEITREKIRADKKLFVAQNMQLTDAEGRGFWPVYDEYQKGLTALGDRTLGMIQEYANNYQNLSDATAGKLTEDFLAIQADRVKLLQSYLPKFRAVLSDKKVARYYQLENKIYAAVLYDAAKQIPLAK